MTRLRAARITFYADSRRAKAMNTDANLAHRFTMAVLPDGLPTPARDHADLLWRLDFDGPEATMTIRTTNPDANFGVWDGDDDIRTVETNEDVLAHLAPRLTPGGRVQFAVRTNPTRATSDKGQWGKRGTETPIHDPDQMMDWFARRTDGACQVTGQRSLIVINPEPPRHGHLTHPDPHQGGRVVTRRTPFHTVDFRGVLTIDDPTRFADLVRGGIGSGKAFGFGLLQVA